MAHIGRGLEVVRNKTETSNQNKAMAAGNRGAVPKRAADRVEPKEDKRSVKSKTKVVIGIKATAPSGLEYLPSGVTNIDE
jgi:hypothetical protein